MVVEIADRAVVDLEIRKQENTAVTTRAG